MRKESVLLSIHLKRCSSFLIRIVTTGGSREQDILARQVLDGDENI